MPRRARKDLDKIQDKRAEVVRLRAEGKTWDQIAAQVGYSNGSAASKAWRAAIKQHPDQSVDEVRRQEKTRLEVMDSRLSEIIGRAPVKTTSIGRTQWDVRTCTCEVKAATNRDHDPDCQVQPVLDENTVIAAIRERRQLGESLRKLVGADAPAGPTAILDARTQIVVGEINQARAARGERPIQLPEPAAVTMPADQAAAAAAAALTALQPLGDKLRAEAQIRAYAAAGQPPPPDALAIIQGQLED